MRRISPPLFFIGLDRDTAKNPIFNSSIDTDETEVQKKQLDEKIFSSIPIIFWQQQCCPRRDFYTPTPKKGN